MIINIAFMNGETFGGLRNHKWQVNYKLHKHIVILCYNDDAHFGDVIFQQHWALKALLKLNILLNLRHCVLNFNWNSFHKLWTLWDSSFNAFNSLFEHSLNFSWMTTILKRRTHDGILSRKSFVFLELHPSSILL